MMSEEYSSEPTSYQSITCETIACEPITKQAMRKLALAGRNALGKKQREFLSEKICERLVCRLRSFCDTEAGTDRTLFLYAAIGSEADLSTFARNALEMGFRVAFPRVSTEKAGYMDFYKITSLAELIRGGRYQIPEPLPLNENLIYPDDKDLVFVPGAAFSRKGDRIGYGAGYYDSYFARFPRVQKTGICFEAQLTGNWMTQEHDIRMDFLITEEQEIRCNE